MPVRQAVSHLLDFCFPRFCAVCENPSHRHLCDACDEDLTRQAAAPACERCAMPLAMHDTPCPYCQGRGVSPFDRIVSLGVFADPLRHLIHQIKYHGQWSLAEALAQRLSQQQHVRAVLTDADLVLAVPLHPLRQMARGYNQSEVVARRLAGGMRVRFGRPVVRLKNTETQTHLHSKDKRMENLREAFGLLKPRQVRGRRVVVVDDVMTTGATLHAMAMTLKEAEPASLSAVVVAVADPRGRGFETI